MRERLVALSLEWEAAHGIAPAITSALAEYDAAALMGLTELDFRRAVGMASAVRKGYDFEWRDVRHQIKANRPSGKKRSFVTKAGKATNYDFDELIWVLYDKEYRLQEAWLFQVDDYKLRFDGLKHVRPVHMREGRSLLEKSSKLRGA